MRTTSTLSIPTPVSSRRRGLFHHRPAGGHGPGRFDRGSGYHPKANQVEPSLPGNAHQIRGRNVHHREMLYAHLWRTVQAVPHDPIPITGPLAPLIPRQFDYARGPAFSRVLPCPSLGFLPLGGILTSFQSYVQHQLSDLDIRSWYRP